MAFMFVDEQGHGHDILPCKCGGDPTIKKNTIYSHITNRESTGYFVVCKKCDWYSRCGHDQIEAINKWNEEMRA